MSAFHPARTAGPLLLAFLASGAYACRAHTPASAGTTPQQVTTSLLDADRDFSRAARSRPMRDALGAMFTDGVLMPAPRGEILAGKSRVLGAFATSPDTAARLSWTPVRVGVSADGQHGFTVGFLVATRPDGTRAQFKYLTYWVREKGAWRVAAWRRRPMEMVAMDTTMLPPLLPAAIVAPTGDRQFIAAHRRSLIAAENGFSAEAQRIGVGAAFAVMGTTESLNVGAPNDGRFTRGADNIAKGVAGGGALDAPSTITWGADTALVASSGDLGITFGVIRPKTPPPGAPATGSSFFTIWRRASPQAPWRYVAE
jgi:ketosteroid isomerase-like protein